MKLFGSKQARQGRRERGVERRRVRPRLEALEDRTLPSTFTVLNTNDSGPGSLRDAIPQGQTGADGGGGGTISLDGSAVSKPQTPNVRAGTVLHNHAHTAQ